MRAAILSDIHGNLTALQAVIGDLKQVSPDLVVQAGDLVGGSRNAEVIDLVRERGWPGVYGNAEEMLWMPEQVTRHVRGGQFERFRNRVLSEAIPFLLREIGEERLAWLRNLPKRWTEGELTVMHARPESVWQSPWASASDEELGACYGPLGCRTVAYGHIHHAFVRRLPTFTVANSGALSFSYDGDRRAAYIVIDGDDIEIRRVDYDLEEEIRWLSAVNYPDAEWIAQIYRTAAPIPPPAG
jgi:predicted phosphodiesterase